MMKKDEPNKVENKPKMMKWNCCKESDDTWNVLHIPSPGIYIKLSGGRESQYIMKNIKGAKNGL